MERETISRIREAVEQGALPKHRVGNPGGETELFVQLDRGVYRLK